MNLKITAIVLFGALALLAYWFTSQRPVHLTFYESMAKEHLTVYRSGDLYYVYDGKKMFEVILAENKYIFYPDAVFYPEVGLFLRSPSDIFGYEMDGWDMSTGLSYGEQHPIVEKDLVQVYDPNTQKDIVFKK